MTRRRRLPSRRPRGLMILPWLLGLAAPAAAGQVAPDRFPEIRDPHARPKHGPVLTRVFHKVDRQWLRRWLAGPAAVNADARMPDLGLAEDDILAVMAWLKSVAGAPLPSLDWPPFLRQGWEEMSEEEWFEMDELVEAGRGVWGQRRCSICHGAAGNQGFVDLRVSSDLSNLARKVDRDWLYAWLEDPAAWMPHTLMPRYRMTEEERRALVEFLLRDDGFLMQEEDPEWPAAPTDEELDDPDRIARGREVIQRARCLACHVLEGVPDLLPAPPQEPVESSPMATLANDVKCLTCHTLDGRGGRYAPELTREGDKLTEAWLRTFLGAPDMVRPLSQQMPLLGLSEEEVEVAVRFAKDQLRLPQPPLPEAPADAPDVATLERGAGLFDRRSCRSCHRLPDGGGALGPDLELAAGRLEPAWLWFHLVAPREAAPFSAEPDLALAEDEARALFHYLRTFLP